GAHQSSGTVVVIDVLRAFTVSAYALAGGARECRRVRTVDEARELANRTPGAVLCAEEDGLPVAGIAISNSPTRIREADLRDRVLIQRSSAGTQAAAAVESGDIWAASLIVARATVQACLLRKPETLTLVASADYPEDHPCATYMDARAWLPSVDRNLAHRTANTRTTASWHSSEVAPQTSPVAPPTRLRARTASASAVSATNGRATSARFQSSAHAAPALKTPTARSKPRCRESHAATPS